MERFEIVLEEVPAHLDSKNRWEASCGAYHARGKEPADAVALLISYVRERRLEEKIA